MILGSDSFTMQINNGSPSQAYAYTHAVGVGKSKLEQFSSICAHCSIGIEDRDYSLVY